MSHNLFENYVKTVTFVLSSHLVDMRHLSTLTSSSFPLASCLFPFTFSRVWHPAIVDDAIYMLQYLSQKYSNAKIFLAGYSAGSNIVHNTLWTLVTSVNNKIQIYGVFCCCVNWCYSTTLKRLENSGSISGMFYSSLLSHQVKVCEQNHHTNWPSSSFQKILSNTMHHIAAEHGEVVKHSLSQSYFISEIDRVTSKIYGFSSVEEMYEVYSSLKRYCQETQNPNSSSLSLCPIFLLQPSDDPLHQVWFLHCLYLIVVGCCSSEYSNWGNSESWWCHLHGDHSRKSHRVCWRKHIWDIYFRELLFLSCKSCFGILWSVMWSSGRSSKGEGGVRRFLAKT